MKLDSEEQREKLLKLLGSMSVETTVDGLEAAKKTMDELLDPIRNAGIECGPALVKDKKKPRRRAKSKSKTEGGT